jgi:hypothetical protein
LIVRLLDTVERHSASIILGMLAAAQEEIETVLLLGAGKGWRLCVCLSFGMWY